MRYLRFPIALAAALLAGCVPAPQPSTPTPAAALPAPCRPTAMQPGSRLLRFDPARSHLEIHVYRAGKLARLGHNHIVSTRAIEGFVELAEPIQRSRVALCLPVADFTVDDTKLRAAAGDDFSSQPTPEDIAATRRNMLSETQLDANRFPYVIVTGEVRGERGTDLELTVQFTVRNHHYSAPATVRLERGFKELIARGELPLELTELGIEPYSALFGALRVADGLVVKFELASSISD